MKQRFRGFLPVVVDIETSGMEPKEHALLEVCFVLLELNASGQLTPGNYYFEHIQPFEGAALDEKSLAFTGIDPFQPLRFAIDEADALRNLFAKVESALKEQACERAVLVGHNAWFDLLFLNEASRRTGIKSPFHRFTCFDTATLAGMAYGQTVLAKAMQAAKLTFDCKQAHSAIYDATKTAELFCQISNMWPSNHDKPPT